MKFTKRFLSMVLVLVTLCSMLVLPASAAFGGFDWVSDSKYCRTYTLANTGITKPYTSSSLSTRGYYNGSKEISSSGAWIGNDVDQIYIYDVGVNDKGQEWARISYPAGSKRLTAYIFLSDITKANGTQQTYTATGKFYCSTRSYTANSSSYWVDAGDKVVHIACEGGKTQILYPIGANGKNGYRLAWCDTADFVKYCLGQPSGAVSMAEGTYQLRSALNTNMAVDIYGNRSAAGTNVQLYYADTNNAAQKFRIEQVSGVWYRIIHIASGKVLDVSSGSRASGTNCQIWDWNATPAQLWCFIPKGSYYEIRSALGCALDVYNASTAAENNIWLYTPNGTNAQKFQLKRLDAEPFWQWPMNNYQRTQSFNVYNSSRVSTGRPYHCGIDMTTQKNSRKESISDANIYAAAAGTVVYRGSSESNGYHVVLQHNFNGTTVKTLYSHLSSYAACPAVGQSVAKGQKIGVMGNTGRSSGPHLHFSIYTGTSNDPWGYTPYNSANKVTYQGHTFYDPAYVLANGRLP